MCRVRVVHDEGDSDDASAELSTMLFFYMFDIAWSLNNQVAQGFSCLISCQNLCVSMEDEGTPWCNIWILFNAVWSINSVQFNANKYLFISMLRVLLSNGWFAVVWWEHNSSIIERDKKCQHTTPVAGYVICQRNGN